MQEAADTFAPHADLWLIGGGGDYRESLEVYFDSHTLWLSPSTIARHSKKWPAGGTITMFKNTFLVLGVGLSLGFGLPLTIGADDTSLARQEVTLTTLDGPGNVGQFTYLTIGRIAWASSATTT